MFVSMAVARIMQLKSCFHSAVKSDHSDMKISKTIFSERQIPPVELYKLEAKSLTVQLLLKGTNMTPQEMLKTRAEQYEKRKRNSDLNHYLRRKPAAPRRPSAVSNVP